ncbi:MAG: hypothetical protein DPW18_06575 [Chloroflexi bacterium]|nr:hypothetical protein [Chloroflexota bacterium]MDL1942151.1 hypothetical protein [Chloroflexi bacterium CFX2]
MNRQRGLPASLALLMTALACAVPGVTTSAPPASPTPDTRLEIMVAGTVSAALQLTQQAAPAIDLAATSTPAPTSAEIAATPTQSAESVLNKNADGTSSFIDLLGKYEVTIPMPWLALRVNAPEFLDAWLLPEASNPAIQRSLGAIQGQDPNLFRLFLLDINEEHIDGGFVTNVNFLWDQQENLSLPDDARLQELADSLPASIEGAEVLTTEVLTTKDGVPFGVITSRTPAVTQDGANIVIYQKLAFFELPVGALSITLSTTETWQETVVPSFDEIVESFAIRQ